MDVYIHPAGRGNCIAAGTDCDSCPNRQRVVAVARGEGIQVRVLRPAAARLDDHQGRVQGPGLEAHGA